ncbi:hypothetical protein AB7M63_001886 [Bradyrhizobium japonicum]
MRGGAAAAHRRQLHAIAIPKCFAWGRFGRIRLVHRLLFSLEVRPVASDALAPLGCVRSSPLASFTAALTSLTATLRPLRERRQTGYGCIDRLGLSRLDRLIECGARLHEFEHGPTFFRDLPPTAFAIDQSLRKYIEIRYARGQSLGPVGPVPAASRQDCHVALDVVHHSESVRVGHQDLQHCDLKIHRRVSRSAPHGRRPGKGFAADPPKVFGRDVSTGRGFQDL